MEKNAKIVPFFYKEWKRMQRLFRSFEKNGCPILAIRSQSLICLEQSEQITHSHSFYLSEISKWANERVSNEQMSEFPALLIPSFHFKEHLPKRKSGINFFFFFFLPSKCGKLILTWSRQNLFFVKSIF